MTELLVLALLLGVIILALWWVKHKEDMSMDPTLRLGVGSIAGPTNSYSNSRDILYNRYNGALIVDTLPNNWYTPENYQYPEMNMECKACQM